MPNLASIKRWCVDRLMTHDACCLLSHSNDFEERYAYSLLGDDRYWHAVVEIRADSPAQASHVMGILVAEMRQVGIDRWLMQHRAFMKHRVVVLNADQVVITPYPRSSVRDSADDNYGAW
jgi:hypothetical protein